MDTNPACLAALHVRYTAEQDAQMYVNLFNKAIKVQLTVIVRMLTSSFWRTKTRKI